MSRYETKITPGGFLLFKDGLYVERVSEDGIISNRPLEDGEYKKYLRMFDRMDERLRKNMKTGDAP